MFLLLKKNKRNFKQIMDTNEQKVDVNVNINIKNNKVSVSSLGSSADDNDNRAEAIRLMLKGKPSAYRDIVIFNAAAALMIAGKAKFLKEGALIAAEAIDNGTAKSTLDKLVKITNFDTNRG
jgi:anthranilate phosphoribosyltransferase